MVLRCNWCKRVISRLFAGARFCGRECQERCRESKRAYSRRPDVKERQRAYFRRPDVKERQRAYRQRSDVKERQRAYLKEYWQRPDVKERRAGELLDRKIALLRAVPEKKRSKACCERLAGYEALKVQALAKPVSLGFFRALGAKGGCDK